MNLKISRKFGWLDVKHCTQFFCHDCFAKIPSNQRFTVLKNFTLSWFDGNNLRGSEFLVFPHCVREFSLTHFSQNFVKVIFCHLYRRNYQIVDMTTFLDVCVCAYFACVALKKVLFIKYTQISLIAKLWAEGIFLSCVIIWFFDIGI